MFTSSYHLYPILLDRHMNRYQFMEFMKTQGIQTSIHYPPVHRFSYHERYSSMNMDVEKTEDVSSREVTLPLYPDMSNSEVKKVVQNVKEFFVQK